MKFEKPQKSIPKFNSDTMLPKYKGEMKPYKLQNNLLQLLNIYLETAKHFGFVIE